MPLVPHLVRRGAVYYWRRRLPHRLAVQRNRGHVCLSLKTCMPHHARSLATQLDAVLAEIAMRAEADFLSGPQLDAILREVIATHSAKLDRIAAAEKCEPGFDATEFFASSGTRRANSWSSQVSEAEKKSSPEGKPVLGATNREVQVPIEHILRHLETLATVAQHQTILLSEIEVKLDMLIAASNIEMP